MNMDKDENVIICERTVKSVSFLPDFAVHSEGLYF